MILVDHDAARRYADAGLWGKVSLDGILARNAKSRPDDVALVDRGDRLGWQRKFSPELTWKQLDRMVSSLSGVFLDSGLKQDDFVAVQLGNSAETLITYLAALRAGLIPLAVPLTWREREMTTAFQRIAPVAAVTATRIGPNDHTMLMMRAAAKALSVRHIFAFGDPVPDGIFPIGDALSPNAPTEGGYGAPRIGNPADHVAVVSFASWDGQAEPVARTHNQWLTAAMEMVLDARISKDAVLATTLLPTSLAGIACGLAAWLLTGCKLILVMPVTSAAFAREISRLAATHLVIPGKLTHLAAQLDPDRRMRLIRYWGAPEAFEPSEDDGDLDMPATDVVSLDEMALSAAHGRRALLLPVAPYAVAEHDEEFDDGGVVDPKAALLSARMPGAMFRSGGTLMPGALMSGALLLGGPQVPTKRLPLAIEDPGKESFRYRPQPDGFRETGLRCRRIDNHRPMLAVNGYRKETFVTGGMVVGADSLDEIYRAYDGFLDAAAASVPDPLFGEKIVAAVVPRPGSDSSLAVFRAYLRGLGVSAHLIPERIVTVSEIPRAGDGAVLRPAIATSMAA